MTSDGGIETLRGFGKAGIKEETVQAGGKSEQLELLRRQSLHSVPTKKGPLDPVQRSPSLQTVPLRKIPGTVGDSVGSTMFKELKGLSGPVKVLCVVADAVWGGLSDGSCVVWDKTSSALVRNFKMHIEEITCLVAINKGREVWSSCGSELKIWDLTGTMIAKINVKHKVTCIADVPDPVKGSLAVWVGLETKDKGLIEVYDASSRKIRKKLDLIAPTRVTVESHSTTKPLAMLFHGNHVWVASGRIIYCFEAASYLSKGYLEGHKGDVKYLLSVGKEIWSCGDDKVIKVWDPEKAGGNVLFTIEGHLGTVMSLATDEANQYVWSCGWGKQILMWNVRSHVFVRWLPEKHTSTQINSLCTVKVADGVRLWSAGDDKTVLIWK
eukprot:TRINITY_DN1026_c0_g2_i1.p1 TRINITY_DN1026_c0_g2~~TRINITY_DN1026_c0_g2_i1.p1  ORF type:complete len:382 (+),score=100.01 TRINITY_DN1026_c0_g2_i1:2-1147(+)